MGNIHSLKSRKNEARSIFKKCFKNSIFSFVPFEIWRDLIVSNADLQSITLLSKTCHAFKDIVDIIGENNLNLALLFRKEGQIDLARKYLLKCANNNNTRAMFHLGDAYLEYGWGLHENEAEACEWLKKSAELGDFAGMARFAYCLGYSYGVKKDEELSNVWAQKALSSNNPYAIGYCHYIGMGTAEDNYKAFSFFEASANEGDEFGREMLAIGFYYGFGIEKDFEKAYEHFLAIAERGSCYSQRHVGDIYRYGERDLEKAIFW